MDSNTSNDQRQEYKRGQYMWTLAYVDGMEEIIVDSNLIALQIYRVFGHYPLPSIAVDFA